MSVPPKAKVILDMIAEHESNGDYEIVWGRILPQDRPPKPLTQMTVEEVLAWQDSIDSKYRSEAAGRYQVMEDTLRELVIKGKVDPKAKYDAKTQDEIGFELMKRRGWSRFENGEISEIEFGNNLAKEWASLPMLSGSKAGQSFYGGDGLNKAGTSPDRVLEALRAQAPAEPALPVSPVEQEITSTVLDETAPTHAELSDPIRRDVAERGGLEVGGVPAGSPDAAGPFREAPQPGPELFQPNSFLGDVISEFSDSGVIREMKRQLSSFAPFSDNVPDDPKYAWSEDPRYVGNEHHWRALSEAKSAEQFSQILKTIRQEEIRRGKIEAGNRFWAPAIGGLLQPESIAAAVMIPGSMGYGFVRSAARVGAASLAFDASAEVLRRRNNPLVTDRESAIRLTSSTILGGLMGGTFGAIAGDRAARLATELGEDLAARGGIAKTTRSVKTPDGLYKFRFNADMDPEVKARAHNGVVEINPEAVSREWQQGAQEPGFVQEFPTASHYAEYQARVEIEKARDSLPFGGYDFEIPDTVKANGRTIKVVLRDVDDDGKPFNAFYEHDKGTITMSPEGLAKVYAARGWTKMKKLRDGTTAKALDENQFKTFEDFVNFVFAHEFAHARLRPHKGEKLGAYEDRINKAAMEDVGYYVKRNEAKYRDGSTPQQRRTEDAELSDLLAKRVAAFDAAVKRVGKKEAAQQPEVKALDKAIREVLDKAGPLSRQASPGGGKPPPPPRRPEDRAYDGYKRWSSDNRRELKNKAAKIIDRMVDGPYKRVHRNSLDGRARALIDDLALDGGLQTVAMMRGETPGASVSVLSKLWEGEVHLLKDAEDRLYEAYLGFQVNPRVGDVPINKSFRRTRKNGEKAIGVDEFGKRAARAYISGKVDDIPQVNEYANAIRTFFDRFREDGLEVGALGNMSGERGATRLQMILDHIGVEPGYSSTSATGKTVWKQPTGIHRKIEDQMTADFDEAGQPVFEPRYVRYREDLSNWRRETAEFKKLLGQYEKDIRAAYEAEGLDPPDFEELYELPDSVSARVIGNATDGEDNIHVLGRKAQPKPQPPLDRSVRAEKVLAEELDAYRKSKAELQQALDRSRGDDLIEEDYFTRVFNRSAIKKHPEKFKEILRKGFAARGMSAEDAKVRADDLFEELTTQADAAIPGRAADSIPSTMRRRGLGFLNRDFVDIKVGDGSVIDFIETDPKLIAHSYAQRTGSYIEFMRKFNPDGFAMPHQRFNELMEEARAAEEAAWFKKHGNTSKAESDFQDHWAPMERDLLLMKDRVLHNTMTEPSRWDNRAAGVLRDWATLAFMGRSSISTLPDMAKIQMTHGIDEVARFALAIMDRDLRPTIGQLAGEARRAGALTDVALGGLMKKFMEVGTEPLYLSTPERWLRAGANRYFIANGLGPITYGMRSLTGAISADRFAEDAVKWAAGEAGQQEIARLAQYGINEQMAKRIAEQLKQFGENKEFWTANTDAWTDKGAKRAYRAAINNEIDNTILVASAADKPTIVEGVVHFRKGNRFIDGLAKKHNWQTRGDYWRAHSGLATLPFQFWNYSIAAHNKIAVAALNNPDARVLGGLVIMAGMGYMALKLRTPEYAWNSMTPLDRLTRVIDQSGMTGVMSEYAYMFQNGFGGLTGINPYPTNYRWGRKPGLMDAVTEFAGPSSSVLQSVTEGAIGLATGDKKAVNNLSWGLPGRNHILLKDTIDSAVDSIQRAIN